jgi:hypothetical protein
MSKNLTLLAVCVASVLVFGCAVKPKTELPLTGIIASNQQSMPDFNAVSVNGPYDVFVNVKTNYYNTGSVAISGDSGLVNYTHYFVKNRTLTIFIDPDYEYNPNVHVKVTMEVPGLKRVYLKGGATINAQHVNTPHFQVKIKNAGSATIAGNATRFDATLTGTAKLDAKCMYADAIFVNTTGYAQAEVLGSSGVSGLAADHSNIYYYSTPDMTEPYQRQSGSMMRMDGILPATVPQTSNVQVRSNYK